MQLNLNKFLQLQKASSDAKLLLISASDECSPVVHNLTEFMLKQLGADYVRHSFSADRYFDFQIIQEIVQSASLFGDKNFIEVNFKTKPTLEQQKQLLTLLTQLDEQNFLCLSCDKLDKKELAASWVQQIEPASLFLNLQGDANESRAWAIYLFKQTGLRIAEDALDLLLSMNQNNFAQLQQEISKLCLLYSAPYEISLADAKANLVDNAQFNIFALSNAYLSGDACLANKIFINVCSSTEDSILVLWNLAEDIRKLLRIKGALKVDPNFNNALNGLRIWGESVALFRQANQRLAYQTLLAYLDELAQMDCMIKGVKAGAALIKLEHLIVNFSRGV